MHATLRYSSLVYILGYCGGLPIGKLLSVHLHVPRILEVQRAYPGILFGRVPPSSPMIWSSTEDKYTA